MIGTVWGRGYMIREPSDDGFTETLQPLRLPGLSAA
jgi:hypothetical protein